MPLWDFTCPVCHITEEHLIASGAPYPTHCDDLRMVRQPAAPSFVVKGYNAKNQYSHTTKELASSVHGQKNTKVTVSGNL